MKIRFRWILSGACFAAALLAGVASGQDEEAIKRASDPIPHPGAPEGCTAIPDGAYNGTLGSMGCFNVDGPGGQIEDLDVQVAMAHTWVGDLVVKLVNPAGDTVVTLMSRPALAEPDDGVTATCCGDSSDLSSSFPVTFDDDGGGPSAETMGSAGDTSHVACEDDGICNYTPDYGAALPGNLASFDGQESAGTWQLCVGDGAGLDTGSICAVTLIATVSAPSVLEVPTLNRWGIAALVLLVAAAAFLGLRRRAA